MAVNRTYKCDLCGDTWLPEQTYSRLVGLHWTGDRWRRMPANQCERHICVKCLSSLQESPKVCGAGFEGCPGGPNCTSDHK